jgi:hypothetical protein
MDVSRARRNLKLILFLQVIIINITNMDRQSRNKENELQCLLMDIQGLKSRIMNLNVKFPLYKFEPHNTLLKNMCLSKSYQDDWKFRN